MDKLEEHVRKNRNNMDPYDPPSHVWRKISRNLKKDRFITRKWISIAAMIVVILGSVVLFRPVYRWSDKEKSKNSPENLAIRIPQLKETEMYYNSLVNTLYREAKPLLANKPDLSHELNNDMSHLDSICADLKKDLKDNVSNQDVVEALIQNYRIKIQILEDMLSVLKANEEKQENKKSHELL
jgi:hypothetical protein